MNPLYMCCSNLQFVKFIHSLQVSVGFLKCFRILATIGDWGNWELVSGKWELGSGRGKCEVGSECLLIVRLCKPADRDIDSIGRRLDVIRQADDALVAAGSTGFCNGGFILVVTDVWPDFPHWR